MRGFLILRRGDCPKIEREARQTNRFKRYIFRVHSPTYFASERFESIRPKSTLTAKFIVKFLGLYLLNALLDEQTSSCSRHDDRSPVLPKHEITLQRGQSEFSVDVGFIDMTPNSLRMRFPLAL